MPSLGIRLRLWKVVFVSVLIGIAIWQFGWLAAVLVALASVDYMTRDESVAFVEHVMGNLAERENEFSKNERMIAILTTFHSNLSFHESLFVYGETQRGSKEDAASEKALVWPLEVGLCSSIISGLQKNTVGTPPPQLLHGLLKRVEEELPRRLPTLDEVSSWKPKTRREVAIWAFKQYIRSPDFEFAPNVLL